MLTLDFDHTFAFWIRWGSTDSKLNPVPCQCTVLHFKYLLHFRTFVNV